MKKIKLITCLSLSIATMVACGTCTVFAATHYIKDAIWYKQLKSNWCWAAVSETIINKETPNFTAAGFANRQSRIVNIAKGNLPNNNVTGNTDDMITAMKEINNTAFRRATWDYISGVSELDDIVSEIMSDDVVGVNLYNARPPYYDGQSLKGHSTFAYWADDSNNNILLGDPWNSSNYIDVYQEDLLYDGFYCHAFPAVRVYGGIYLKY